MNIHRRSFLKHASIISLGSGVVAAIPVEILATMRKYVAPGDKINAGVIGCRGQGWSNLTSLLRMPEVTCTAICDVDTQVLNNRKADLEKLGIKPTIYHDYRQLLDDKKVDFVIIATPDHWHCLQMIDACKAGKPMLLEKPVSNSVGEAQLMLTAAKKYNALIQVNQWQRSQQHFKDAISYVHSGKLGTINNCRAWMYRGGTTALPVHPNEPVPAGINYKAWLGPAPDRTFNKNRFHYEFRWYWDYAGGLMTDWGVHLIDMVIMGMQSGTPRSIQASGGKYIFPRDARETPDLQTAIYDYGDHQLIWEHNMDTGLGPWGRQHGISFTGENGTLLLSRAGWEVRADKVKGVEKMQPVNWQPASDHGLHKHTENFIAAVKSRNGSLLNCPIEAGVEAAIHAHMGNIALRSNEKISWDDKLQKFATSRAQDLHTATYHNGYTLPKIS